MPKSLDFQPFTAQGDEFANALKVVMGAVKGLDVRIASGGGRTTGDPIGVGLISRRGGWIGSHAGPDGMHHALEIGHAGVIAELDVFLAGRGRG